MNNWMKWVVSSVIALFVVSCATTHHNELAVGKLTKEELFTSYGRFSEGYQQTTLSAQDINIIEQWPDDVRVDVYFGTWCHDSQREVPQLLKILSHKPKLAVNLIALDYQKSDPQGLAVSKGIKYTPTMIVMKNNKELGRIIERPKKSLIVDIDALVR